MRPIAVAILVMLTAAHARAEDGPIGADTGAQSSIEVSETTATSDATLEARFGLGFAAPAIADEFTDTYHPGGQVLAEVGAGFDDLHLGLALGYARLAFNSSRLTNAQDSETSVGTLSSAEVEGGSLNLLSAMLQGRWDLTEAWLRPYLVGGGGAVFSVPEEATADLTITDDAGAETTRRLSADYDNRVDPVLMLGVGASDVSGPVDIFGQFQVSVMLGDEVVPLLMASVGVGL